jgi:hypothetical protein
MKKDNKPRNRGKTVIPLEDLVPRKDPKGGKGSSARAVFGGGPVIPEPERPESVKKERGKRE